VRAWPVWKKVVVGTACLLGLVSLIQTPWRPALGLLGLLVLVTVVLAVDAWGLRGRVPLLRSHDMLHAAAGWAMIGGLLLGAAVLAGPAQASPSSGSPTARVTAPNSPRTVAPLPSAEPPQNPAVIVESPSPSPTPSPTTSPSPTPTRSPSPSPPRGVTFLNAPLSARLGRPVSLAVLTAPNTSCSISVGYTSAPDLSNATSDSQGNVRWTWRVSRFAPAGTWPIVVSCGGVTATTQITLS